MPRSRITITIPEDLVVAADRRAKELERSRSWVVVEAVRRYLSERPPAGEEIQVREDAASTYGEEAGGLGAYRRARLRADLALSPETRVKEAERAARVAELRARRWERDRVITFDRYEDYLDWERWEDRAR